MHLSLMPGLHLPLVPCDIFVYDFLYDLSGISVCVYIVYINHGILYELLRD